MNRSIILAGLGAALTMAASSAFGQEVETFDSPNQLQTNNGNFTFTTPITGSFRSAITDNPTSIEITSATGGYGTAYKNIFALDKPPAGQTNGVISIVGSDTLQLDLTINSGDAGPFIDLTDGEGDGYQYFYGYGLVGGAANNAPPQSPGETITQGAAPNELILDVPLATPHTDLNGTGTFDFSQIVNFRLEDDPGTVPSYDIAVNDLSGVTTAAVPEPASLGVLAVGCLLVARRRRRA